MRVKTEFYLGWVLNRHQSILAPLSVESAKGGWGEILDRPSIVGRVGARQIQQRLYSGPDRCASLIGAGALETAILDAGAKVPELGRMFVCRPSPPI